MTLRTIEPPTEKVNMNDHAAVAAGMAKLLADPNNHCQNSFGFDPDGYSLSLSEIRSGKPAAKICLAAARHYVCGDEVITPGWDQSLPTQAFVEQLAGELGSTARSICNINNEYSHEKLVGALNSMASKKAEAA